jgi:tryptophan synthase alpha chain
MNPVDILFRRLRSTGRKAFIPFVTAGDPDLDSTKTLVHEVVRHGADLVEIGFPYSDPIADGPVIQASYTRALSHGIHVDDILAMVRELHADLAAPLVGMLSYALVHRREPERFVSDARDAGLAGLIIPDLPVDEAEELGALAKRHELALILLITPTTPRERALRIAQLSTGFLYCVSVTGVTGERDRIPEELVRQLSWLRQKTSLPLCAGFGISKPDHVQSLRDAVDGVIVGSAIVRLLERVDERTWPGVVEEVGRLTSRLVQALNPA